MLRTLTISLLITVSLAGCQSTSSMNQSTDKEASSSIITNSDVDSSTSKSAYDYNKWQHDWYHRNGGYQ